MSKILALNYAERVNKVNKSVIDAFEAGYNYRTNEIKKETEGKDFTFLIRKAKGVLLNEISKYEKDIEETTLGIGYNDLRGKGYDKAMDDIKQKEILIKSLKGKIEVIISENKFLRKISEIIDIINKIKTEPIPRDITLKDAITKVYGKKMIGFDKIKLNDFINALNINKIN